MANIGNLVAYLESKSTIEGALSGSGALSGELNNGIAVVTKADYGLLYNKPSINGVELSGDVSLEELDIATKEYLLDNFAEKLHDHILDDVKDAEVLSNADIEGLFLLLG